MTISKYRPIIIGLALSVILVGSVAHRTSTAVATAIPATDQTTVVVKFKASAAVEPAGKGFARSAQPDTRLNALMSAAVSAQRPLIDEPKASIQQRKSQAVTPLPQGEGDLENYYVLKLKPGKSADSVAAELKKLDSVETAYAKVLPPPAPFAPNFTSQQTHLKLAPTGHSVYTHVGTTSQVYPASTGSLVKIADIEYGWNAQHEDLSRLRKTGAYWKNGTPIDPFADGTHGSGVAGIIAGDRNSGGITGIAPDADFHTVNIYNQEREYDPANAIYLAANKMTKGDIILLEAQTYTPDNQGYVAVEFIPEAYDAIRYATSKGIIVIEAAGNGKINNWEGYNLASSAFGGAFTTKANSGAIMVGASNSGCDTSSPRRSRLAFSNYGTRVDVQAYGNCVVTAGGGDLYNAGSNALYTQYFSGTSSASAIIAGLASELSSSYEYVRKAPISPATLRTYLRSGGLAQNTTVYPGAIGPMPDMASALKRIDIVAPTAPAQLTAALTTNKQVSLHWNAATDNLGFVTYKVYRGTTLIKQTTSTSYLDTTATTGTHSYKVIAVDASDNASAASNIVKITK